jgi:adenylate cyclase
MTDLSDRNPTERTALTIIEWLAGDECHELDDAGLIAGLGHRLRSAGLPIDRLVLHLRTLHPELFARTVAWAPDEPVEIRDREHGIEVSEAFRHNPLWRVFETREPLSVRRSDSNFHPLTRLDVLRGRPLEEILLVPLCNADGPVSAASFCTMRPDGFTVSDYAFLERLVPALRSACELRMLRQIELTLLDTYIGSGTARRILAGQVRRGQVESVDAALMLCDLRGFTELSNQLAPERVLALLDDYFDRVVPAIGAAGGEVLKFMGDAVLAFFPQDTADAACAMAVAGAENVLASLERRPKQDSELSVGIALHYGRVSYGNIGSGRRLDFTVIGPDVNLVSRIQSVCSTTGHRLLVSERFLTLLHEQRFTAAGSHVLKGFEQPVRLYTIASAER